MQLSLKKKSPITLEVPGLKSTRVKLRQGFFYPIRENVRAKKDVRTDAHAQNIRVRRLKRLLRQLPSRQQLLRRLLQPLRLLRLSLHLRFQIETFNFKIVF